MYLQRYQTPSSKIRTTVATSGDILPGADDRLWVIIQNVGKTEARIAFTGEEPAIVLSTKERCVLPSPSYLGPLSVLSGDIVFTELVG